MLGHCDYLLSSPVRKATYTERKQVSAKRAVLSGIVNIIGSG